MEKLLLENQLIIMQELLYQSNNINVIKKLREQINFTRQTIENLK